MPKPALTGFVSITGTPKIGQPLTATPSLPSDAGALTYKWYRGDDTTPISGANAKTYTPSMAADVDKKIKVEVAAENYSGSVTATTAVAVTRAAFSGTVNTPSVYSKSDTQVIANKEDGYVYGVTLKSETSEPSSWTATGIISGLSPNTEYKLWGRVAQTDTVEASSGQYVEFTTLKSQIADGAKGTLDGYTGAYDGTSHNAVTGSADEGYTVTYSTSESGSYSSTMPTVTNVADSKTVWVKLSKAGFEDKVFELTAKVTPKNISSAIIEFGTQNTYNGSRQDVRISSVKDGMTPLTSTIDYTIKSGGEATNVEDTTLVIEGKGNYTGTASKVWSLAAKEVTITPDAKSKTYGDADPELTYTTSIDSDTTLKPLFVAAVGTTKLGRADGEDAGTYAINLGTLNAGSNFHLTLDTTVVNFTINQKNAPDLRATAPDQTTIKGVGEFTEPVVYGVDENPLTGTITYDFGETDRGHDKTETVNKLKEKNAGYSILLTYHFVPTSTNYRGSKTGNFTITVNAKTDVSGSITFSNGELTYTGSAQTYENATVSGVTGGTWEYTYAANAGTGATLDGGKPKTVGTYTVTATYEDSVNYGQKTATLTIKPKQITAPAADSTVYTYTGAEQTYGITATGDYTVTNGTQTNANESGYTVTVALSDKTNTVWADTNNSTDKTYSFVIKKATPTGTPSYTAITTSGETLADAALSIGSITPEGEVKWVADDGVTELASGTAVAANTTYKWLFTPTDTTNYNTLTGSIELYHVSYSGGGGSSSYAISVDKTENGTITVSPKSASRGSTVTVTAAPDKGYELDTLTVLDKNGKEIKLTEKNGKYTFTMPASKVTVKGSFVKEPQKQSFADVPTDAYYYAAVEWAAEQGITGGMGGGLFGPGQPCTRAQIVTFLWRAAGSPEPKAMSSFTDVPADAWYAKAVAWAVENGITAGVGNGLFGSDDTCTRAQAVTFLYRAAGAPAVSGNAAFRDVAADAYYAAAVKWAEENGITGGVGGGRFGSDDDCTRAQIVTFLYCTYNK